MDYSGKRAQHLAETVCVWINDPKTPRRQMGILRMIRDIFCTSGQVQTEANAIQITLNRYGPMAKGLVDALAKQCENHITVCLG